LTNRPGETGPEREHDVIAVAVTFDRAKVAIIK
jgi:hypothetical protein